MTDTDSLKAMVFLPCKHPIQEEIIKTAKESAQFRWCLHCGNVYQPRQVYAYYFGDPLPLKTDSVEELAAKGLVLKLKKLNSKIIEQNRALKENVSSLEAVARVNNIEYNTRMVEYQTHKAHHEETLEHLSVFSKKNTELMNKQSELLNALKTTRKNKNVEIGKLESTVSQLKGQLKKINGAFESEKAQKKSLNKKINELESKIDSIQKDNKVTERLKQEITQTHNKNKLTNAALKEKEKELVKILIIKEKLEQTSTNLRTRIAELNKKIDEQTNSLTTMSAELSKSRKRGEEIGKNIANERAQKEECIRSSAVLYQQLCDAQMYIHQMQWYMYGPYGPPQMNPTGPNGPNH